MHESNTAISKSHSAPDFEPYLNIPKCDDEFFHEDCFVCAQCFQERVKKCRDIPEPMDRAG